MLSKVAIAYINEVYKHAIKRVIIAYKSVFEDKEYCYSNYSYIKFLEMILKDPEAKPPHTNPYYIKAKIYEYYKDRDYSYLVINHWGKLEVKPKGAPSKAKTKVLDNPTNVPIEELELNLVLDNKSNNKPSLLKSYTN
jgi:hypothetical protein